MPFFKWRHYILKKEALLERRTRKLRWLAHQMRMARRLLRFFPQFPPWVSFCPYFFQDERFYHRCWSVRGFRSHGGYQRHNGGQQSYDYQSVRLPEYGKIWNHPELHFLGRRCFYGCFGVRSYHHKFHQHLCLFKVSTIWFCFKLSDLGHSKEGIWFCDFKIAWISLPLLQPDFNIIF